MNSVEQAFFSSLNLLSPEWTLSDLQLSQFRIYYSNLARWNSVMNLTAITDEDDVYVKHFLDSLSILNIVPRETFCSGIKLIDIGTGAGFPGLPLAIAFPEITVTLADSLGKRINFLNDTIKKTELKNVTAIHARAEEIGRNELYREQYDIAVSRAVANLSTLNEYCIPLLKIKGRFVAYKGEKADEEIKAGTKAAKIMGAKMIRKTEFVLPGTDYHRIMIAYQKIQHTPSAYPRKTGVPSKKPIK